MNLAAGETGGFTTLARQETSDEFPVQHVVCCKGNVKPGKSQEPSEESQAIHGEN
jgi:hypothetical protein